MRPGEEIEIWGQRSPEGRLSFSGGSSEGRFRRQFRGKWAPDWRLFMDLLGRFASWKGQTEFVKLQVALYSRDDPYE